MNRTQSPVATEATVTLDDVRAAAARLAGVAHRTPVLTSRTLDDRLGGHLMLKAESFQRGGAFKFRGAYNAVASIPPEVRGRGVVTFSSGNHAQAVALAARLHAIPATIIMPLDAPPAKVAATRGYGATIVTYDRYTEDRAAIGARIAAERGATLIPPYDSPPVIAGQGTTALELIEETGPLDLLLVCVGGGGLLAGCAVAATALSPGVEIIGVEPAAGRRLGAIRRRRGARPPAGGAADDRRWPADRDPRRADLRHRPTAAERHRARHRRRDPGGDGFSL